ncbi:hypothetical protein DFH06DRAFT_1234162 [Mycena polygramma]|nr:hypothetical protein DFH06DRAFT_1234162 [Mycena polygramma]
MSILPPGTRAQTVEATPSAALYGASSRAASDPGLFSLQSVLSRAQVFLRAARPGPSRSASNHYVASGKCLVSPVLAQRKRRHAATCSDNERTKRAGNSSDNLLYDETWGVLKNDTNSCTSIWSAANLKGRAEGTRKLFVDGSAHAKLMRFFWGRHIRCVSCVVFVGLPSLGRTGVTGTRGMPASQAALVVRRPVGYGERRMRGVCAGGCAHLGCIACTAGKGAVRMRAQGIFSCPGTCMRSGAPWCESAVRSRCGMGV